MFGPRSRRAHWSGFFRGFLSNKHRTLQTNRPPASACNGTGQNSRCPAVEPPCPPRLLERMRRRFITRRVFRSLPPFGAGLRMSATSVCWYPKEVPGAVSVSKSALLPVDSILATKHWACNPYGARNGLLFHTIDRRTLRRYGPAASSIRFWAAQERRGLQDVHCFGAIGTLGLKRVNILRNRHGRRLDLRQDCNTVCHTCFVVPSPRLPPSEVRLALGLAGLEHETARRRRRRPLSILAADHLGWVSLSNWQGPGSTVSGRSFSPITTFPTVAWVILFYAVSFFRIEGRSAISMRGRCPQRSEMSKSWFLELCAELCGGIAMRRGRTATVQMRTLTAGLRWRACFLCVEAMPESAAVLAPIGLRQLAS